MRAEYRFFLLYLTLSSLLLFLDGKGVLEGSRRMFQRITVPVKTGLYTARLSFLSPFRFLQEGLTRGEKISQLNDKVASLSAEVASRQALEEENRQLRRLLGAPLASSWKFSPARVVVRGSDRLTVHMNGELPEGTPAIIPSEKGGVLVGKLERRLGQEAEVILPTHPESKIPVFTRSLSEGPRVATGIVIGGEGAVLDQVLTGESLKEGHLVFTSGDGGLPPDLLVGRVEEVLPAEGQAWQKARLGLAFVVADFIFFVTDY